MIVMLISDKEKDERGYIVKYSKDLAGKWTEESWKMRQCETFEDLEAVVTEGLRYDLICVDITMKGALDLTKELRRISPTSYIILIASPKISPVIYMKPSIGAESLMLKPLTKQQIEEVLEEAISTYVERFYESDEKKVFVVENKGERKLIDYKSIFFFESRDKRVFVNTGVEEYGFYDTLDQLEQQLSEAFIRCHRSFLINKEKISHVYLSQNRILLKSDFEIPLSRTYKPSLKDFMKSRC